MNRKAHKLAIALLALLTLFSFARPFTRNVYGKLKEPEISVIPSEPQIGQHATVEAVIEIEIC